MCGIAGLYNFTSKADVDADLLDNMCRVIAHRGPDDQGLFIAGPIGLGMRRLSVIDLSTGKQPIHNEDGTIWTVFNGEIYNFRELRAQLEARGHRFYTKADTEVIVHAYEEYGEECVHHFRGMFGFAVWDRRAQKLFIARDRFGIKPLHYTVCDGALLFGSELKSLLQHPALAAEINYQAFNHYLSYLYTPANETMLKGVFKLPPAHTLTVANGQIKIRQYWDIRPQPDNSLTEDEAIERLRELIRESVKLRLVSDVPIGAFLSGGIDSSSVVATMSALLDRPVKTFSVGFPEADFNETQYAREVAARLGTEHYELEVTTSSLEIIDDLIWCLDEPMGDSSAIPTYLVSRLAREHVTVSLSGDGGDELFAGYQHHVRYQGEAIIDKIPLAVRQTVLAGVSRMMPSGMRGKNLLNLYSQSTADRLINRGTFFNDAQKLQLLAKPAYEKIMKETAGPLFPAEFRRLIERRSLADVLYIDLKRYLPLDILTKVDRMSMAHSLEARVPLLDHKLAEFVATIPTELKLRGKSTKYIFKQAMRDLLPVSILERKKQGFALPLKHWLKREWRGFLLDHLLDDRTRARGLFRADYIEELYRDHCAGRDHSLLLWMLLVFELWCRKFVDERPRPKTTK